MGVDRSSVDPQVQGVPSRTTSLPPTLGDRFLARLGEGCRERGDDGESSLRVLCPPRPTRRRSRSFCKLIHKHIFG